MPKDYYLFATIGRSDGSTVPTHAAALSAALAPRPVHEVNPGTFVIGLATSQDWPAVIDEVKKAIGASGVVSAVVMGRTRWFRGSFWAGYDRRIAEPIVQGSW